jgi:hypothetical protein
MRNLPLGFFARISSGASGHTDPIFNYTRAIPRITFSVGPQGKYKTRKPGCKLKYLHETSSIAARVVRSAPFVHLFNLDHDALH